MKNLTTQLLVTLFLLFFHSIFSQSKEMFSCVLQKDTFSFALKRADFGSQDTLVSPLKYYYRNLKDPEEETHVVDGTVLVLDFGGPGNINNVKEFLNLGYTSVIICANQSNLPKNLYYNDTIDISIPIYSAPSSLCTTLKFNANKFSINNICYITTQPISSPDCIVSYDKNSIIFGENAEGSFKDTLGILGWTIENTVSPFEDEVSWLQMDGNELLYYLPQIHYPPYLLTSPTGCNNNITFKPFQDQVKNNPTPVHPYPIYRSELISPAIDCSGKSNVTLEFYQLYVNLANHTSKIAISTDNGLTWSDSIIVPSKENMYHFSRTEKVSIPIPEFDGQSQCKIKFIANMDYYLWRIDDVAVKSSKSFQVLLEESSATYYQNYLTPSYLVDTIPLAINLVTNGNLDYTDMPLMVTITSESGDTIHQQKTIIDKIESGFKTTTNIIFPEPFVPSDQEGKFKVAYSYLQKDSTDVSIIYFEFIIEENTLNKLPTYPSIDWFNTFIRNKKNFVYSNSYYIPNRECNLFHQLALDKTSVKISFNEDEVNGTISSYVFNWTDQNKDGNVQPHERNLLATGNSTLKSDQKEYEIELFSNEQTKEKYLFDLAEPKQIIIINQIETNDTTSFRIQAVDSKFYSNRKYDLSIINKALEELGVKRYGSFTIKPDSSIMTSSFVQDSSSIVFSCPLTFNCEKVSNTINENSAEQPTLFPNPTSGTVFVKNIDHKSNTLNIRIYTVSGKLIKSFSSLNDSSELIELDVTSIDKGIYIVQMNNIFEKLIIN